MLPNIPYIVDGEVYDVSNTRGYIVNVRMPDGTQIMMPDVEVSCMFGGVADFFQRRLRTSKSTKPYDDDMANKDKQDVVNVGDRVLIAFLGGNIRRPMIIGYFPHWNASITIPDREKTKPHAQLSYLGMDMKWDEEGQFEVVHRGAPEISAVPRGGGLTAVSNIASALQTGDSVPQNDAVKFPDTIVLCKMNFDKKGSWRVRDSHGQMIEVNADKERIYIANNSIKSTDAQEGDAGLQIATNSTDSEYVLLDRAKKLVLINARKIAQIYSFDKRKDVTDGDHSHKIGKNETITIGGNKDDTITGSFSRKIGKNRSDTINGNETITILGKVDRKVTKNYSLTAQNYSLTAAEGIKVYCTKSLEMSCAGATLKMSPGKFELSGISGGLQAIICQILDAIMKSTYPTTVGPTGTPINSSEFAAIKQKIMAQKL